MGRLAPTPSGHLHLGNALAFGAAWLSARAAGGRLLLRVEDVDVGRARDAVAAGQREDLTWLGLRWDEEVAPQSARDYQPWLDRLGDRVYRCTCNRSRLRELGGRCDCAARGHREGAVRFRLAPGARVVVDRALGARTVDPAAEFPDPVLRRADGVWAYPLAVVADDLLDGVTQVVRGGDLVGFSGVQEQVWEAFGATPPTWFHTPLVVGADGKKLSKSHGSTEIRALRTAGWSPDDVWAVVLPWLGLPGRLEAALAAWPGPGAPSPQVVAPVS